MAGIAWHETLEEARSAAREHGRPLLIDFWSPG